MNSKCKGQKYKLELGCNFTATLLCNSIMLVTKPFKIISTIFERVFPRRESHRIVASLSGSDTLRCYQKVTRDGFIALSSYKEPSIKALIKEAKFHGNEKAWTLLSLLLDRFFSEVKSQAVLIPIPLSKERQKERKYNQVTEILKPSLKKCPNLRLRSDILYRLRDTKPQTSLKNKEERIRNIENAFSVRDNKSNDVVDADIILVDDVATTGATLKAARAALEPLQPKSIKCIAFAH